MNQKETAEVRRRLAPEKNAITKIHGCFVNNSTKKIITYVDEPMGLIPVDEAETYLNLFKKVLSGGQGRNLIDIVFSPVQVLTSEEHKLLTDLRSTECDELDSLEKFYQKIIDSVDCESNYLILVASDRYDVVFKARDGQRMDDAGDEVYNYIICAVCPVKEGKPSLCYYDDRNEFHTAIASQQVSAPELGFIFPAFDDRQANISAALFYTKDPANVHQDFLDSVFNAEDVPMTAIDQQEAFKDALTEALVDSCPFDVVQNVHEQLRERITEHKESKDPEPLEMSINEIGGILLNSGVPEEEVQAFRSGCEERFGTQIVNPDNIIESKRFTVSTPQMQLNVNPEYAYMVESRIIDGKRYILIPADEEVTVNGMHVQIKQQG